MHRIVPALMLALALLAGVVRAQTANAVQREEKTSGTVERIDQRTRMVTLRVAGNATMQVYAEPAIALDQVRVGDVVTVRYIESVVAEVRRDAKPSNVKDTTEQARRAGGDEIYEQLHAVVTIENIDAQGLLVTYRTADNRKAIHAVKDKAILEGIRPGDRVEITLTRARAISLERKR